MPLMTEENLVRWIVTAQSEGFTLSENDHRYALQLMDKRLLGMDGFKYCWPGTAIQNRRLFLASRNRRSS